MNLGGRDYVIPPLTLGALEVYEDQEKQVPADFGRGHRDLIVNTIHAALKRNYPDMTIADVKDMVDVSNMLDVMEATMDIAGLKRKSIEAGEAAAATA